MDFQYIDAHGHVNDSRFDADRDEVFADLLEKKIATIIVGTDVTMNVKALAESDPANGRYACIGQHPYDGAAEVFDAARYLAWAKDSRCVAIGECGLDYYWPASEGWKQGETEEKERQRALFAAQIAIAREVGKPLMIHGRPNKGTMDAYDDILAMLREAARSPGGPITGDAHFFAGDMRVAKEFLDLGFHCSFTGVLTFTADYDEVVRYIPGDRLMAETDAPYVPPVPYRGKRNESKYVPEIYRAIARIREQELEETRLQINDNARRFFKI